MLHGRCIILFLSDPELKVLICNIIMLSNWVYQSIYTQIIFIFLAYQLVIQGFS